MKKFLLAIAALSLAVTGNPQIRAMGEPDLESEEFTKRFTASYGILSEKEPPLTDFEITLLQKTAPMMRVNREYAQTLLQSLTVAETQFSATFNYLLGNIYFENEEFFLAEEQYKKAIENFPDFQRAWTNLGVLKLRSGDTRSALVALLKAVELGDTKPHTFGMLGYCHYTQGNYISAEVAYDRAMLAEPENLDWLEGKAQVYFEAERYIEAIRMQDELISRRPRNVAYWMAQTNSYLAAEDLEHAARNLEIIHSMGEESFNTLFLLGGLYSKLRMYGPAGEAYLAAAYLADDDDVDYLVRAARMLMRNKQHDFAKSLFDQIDSNSPALADELLFEYRILEGDIAELEGNVNLSITIYEEAEKLDPLDGVVLIKLARLHAKSGDRDKAYFLLDRAENDPEAEYNALLTRVKLLIEEERFEESQVYVGRAMRLKSDDTIQTLYNQVSQAIEDRS